MAPYLSRALCALALVAHASALALRAPVRAPLALGRRTALLRMALPASVMEFVPESVASDTAQMKQIGETWKVISRVYQSDDAALQALRQNSQILLPVYSSPELVKESYDGLLAAMGPASRVDMGLQPGVPYGVQAQGVGVQARVTPLLLLGNQADALEIMKQNPAVLTCGGAIAEETPDEIRKFARVRQTLDKISPEALIGGLVLVVGAIVYKVVANKMGIL